MFTRNASKNRDCLGGTHAGLCTYAEDFEPRIHARFSHVFKSASQYIEEKTTCLHGVYDRRIIKDFRDTKVEELLGV